MGAISIHAVDIAAGCPAAGLRIDLAYLSQTGPVLLLDGALTSGDGMIELPNDARGQFEATLYLGDYQRSMGIEGPAFQEVQTFAFGIDDPARHHHLPLKFTPFGLSLFLTH